MLIAFMLLNVRSLIGIRERKMKRMDKLKPCPFCGAEAEFTTVSNNSNHTGVGFNYIIACSKCNCTPIQKSQGLNVFLDKNGELKITDASVVNKLNMIDEWNTRAKI